MFPLLLFTTLITMKMDISAGQMIPAPHLDGRIVGGQDANIENHPHQVSLQNRGHHICGASIISETKALTAAHCVQRYSSSLDIRVGSSFYDGGGQVIRIASTCPHPYFNSINIDNDVAVLIFKWAIQFNERTKSIRLQNVGSDVPPGDMATVTGWGRLYDGSPPSPRLQVVLVPRISDYDCQDLYLGSEITRTMFCFGYMKGERGVCQGDSGSALVYRGIQVGIVSWGKGCGEAYYPAVYAKVSELRNHIDNC